MEPSVLFKQLHFYCLQTRVPVQRDLPAVPELNLWHALPKKCWTVFVMRCTAGFTALREALGMTSTTGLDEPDVSDSESEEEERPTHHHQQQQQQAAPEATPLPPPAQQAAAGSAPTLPPRKSSETSEKERPRKNEEAKAARAQAVQAEVLQARSMGGPGDWDLDWLADPEVQHAQSAPAMQ